MKLKTTNINYTAVIVEVTKTVAFPNCDNVHGAICLGNTVVAGKDVVEGIKGIYFPLESKLSDAYRFHNNLNRDKTTNLDETKAGYFEKHGRVRAVPFRKNKSQGLFMPLDSLDFLGEELTFNVGDEFNEINGVEICTKYIPTSSRTPGAPGSKKGKGKSPKKESRLVEGQFRFHTDTAQLYKNAHRLTPETLVSITYKIHGTSGISSNTLVKRKLSWLDRLAKAVGIQVVETEYDNIYSSRKVVKNGDVKEHNHFYGVDIWASANELVKHHLGQGLTLYYEIYGNVPGGAMIQKGYDYGCTGDEFGIAIYRITSTQPSGEVVEFSAKQVQNWCTDRGLKAVPQLYYGYLGAIMVEGEDLLTTLTRLYTDKDCFMCANKVPEEGAVIRIEDSNSVEALKLKSDKFYLHETKMLDKGEVDMETEN